MCLSGTTPTLQSELTGHLQGSSGTGACASAGGRDSQIAVQRVGYRVSSPYLADWSIVQEERSATALVDGFLKLECSSGKLEWDVILQKMANDLGLSKILFDLLPKDSQDYEDASIAGSHPATRCEHYDRTGHAQVDPTASHCTQSVLLTFQEPFIYQTRKQHKFLGEASAADLVYGLTMSPHGTRGELDALGLSVEAENRVEANHFMEPVLPTLWMLKSYALQGGAGLALKHPVSKPAVLTSREKEVLQ